MVDKLSEQDSFAKWQLKRWVESLLVGVQIILIVLTVWTIVSLSFHVYLIKQDVVKVKKSVSRQTKPIWFVTDTEKLREDVALEYLLMSTTSTGMIIVIPDDR